MPRRRREPLDVPVSCNVCTVRGLAICSPLNDEDIKVIDRYRAGIRVFPAGTNLYHQGATHDELYTLLDGWVFLYQVLEDGRRQILDFGLPGAFLGIQAELDAPMAHSAQCLNDIAACVFPRRNLIEFMRAQPEIAIRLTWITAQSATLAQEHLTNIGRRNARERLAHLLLELFYRVRETRRNGTSDSAELPLTQEHLGDALGLTPVHVNRTLRQLREAGLVHLGGRVLRILDADALARIAGFSPAAFAGEPRCPKRLSA